MARTKGKGLKPATNDNTIDFLSDPLPVAPPGGPLKAADGHNVDGWADEDIRTYNELLSERAKLEKEKNELEQRSSRHQTQRALLDEHATALDSLFKAQLGGDFKFMGSSTCCLDADLGTACGGASEGTDFRCKHEICMRAKSKGLSWMELDTIKYYHARIMSEKSQRMQNALRKQRDVELVRVKKDDEGEMALRTRKSALLDKAGRGLDAPPANKGDKAKPLDSSTLDMLASKDFLLDPKNSAILDAAKDNEHIVRRIRGRLDKIRQDVSAGRVSPADVRVKLDQANSEMGEAERKNNEFRQMILDAEPALTQFQNSGAGNPASLSTILQNTLASSNADAFSQALSVMKGLFSASDPLDVQNAITDLRSVLELNGPMSPVLQKSFKALEEMLAKPNAKGFTVDVKTGDGKTRTCSNVVEVMMNLRSKMQASDSPSNAADPELNLDEDTIKANLECIKVEDAARKDMTKIAERMAEDTVDNITTALKKIKAKAALKSPIPPLSDIVLDDVINDILFHRSVKALVAEATAGTGLTQLSGKITSLVIATARNKPEKYLDTLDEVKESIGRVKTKTPPQVLLDAASKVEASMTKFVAAHEEKQKKTAVASKLLPVTSSIFPNLAPGASRPAISTKHLLEGTHVDEPSFNLFKKFFDTPLVKDSGTVRARVVAHYHMHLEEGIWEMFRVLARHQNVHEFQARDWEAEKEFYRANMRCAAAVREDKLLYAILVLQERSVCPGMAAIVLAQKLTYWIRDDFEAARNNIMSLRNIFSDYKPGSNREWVHSFNFIAQAMTDLFAIFVFRGSALDPVDVPICAIDIVCFACTFVLGLPDASQAEANLRLIEAFLTNILMEPGNSKENGKLQDVFSRFLHMCQDSRYRCSPEHSCKMHVKQLNEDKIKYAKKAPLGEKKTPKERSVEAALKEAAQGLPRHIHLQMMVDAYWQVARSIMPHLDCLAKDEKRCFCSPGDQEFAEEIHVLKDAIETDFEELGFYIHKDLDPPKTLWTRLEKNAHILHERPIHWGGNQKRIAKMKNAYGITRYEEQLDALAASEKPLDSKQGIQLRKVTVNVPSIEKSVSSNTSEAGNVEKEMSDNPLALESGCKISSDSASSTAKARHPSFAAEPQMPPQSMSTQTSTPAIPPMSHREIVIRDQLLKVVDGVINLDKDVADITGFTLRDALNGVSKQLQEMAIGHIEMAWIVAKAQGYKGLQVWLAAHYGKKDGDIDDEDDIDGMNDPTPASIPAATPTAPKSDKKKASKKRACKKKAAKKTAAQFEEIGHAEPAATTLQQTTSTMQ